MYAKQRSKNALKLAKFKMSIKILILSFQLLYNERYWPNKNQSKRSTHWNKSENVKLLCRLLLLCVYRLFYRTRYHWDSINLKIGHLDDLMRDWKFRHQQSVEMIKSYFSCENWIAAIWNTVTREKKTLSENLFINSLSTIKTKSKLSI